MAPEAGDPAGMGWPEPSRPSPGDHEAVQPLDLVRPSVSVLSAPQGRVPLDAVCLPLGIAESGWPREGATCLCALARVADLRREARHLHG